ncbi:conserved Plasmodium protein, unknown function [Plasmodium chabaudi chabaudi]|uniref:Transcription initiation factor IIF subunit alpha n=1 Tax=Plasmodium chabaudi chabaudi TaxID=31271 RepID=A0A1D3LGR2_PLACU|nr:conserved Plasmodium protein, unknown function [Plasmodium chabaudi chabaudi]
MNEQNDTIKYSDFHLSKYGNKRVRINKTNDNVKYLVSRFTNHSEIDRLTPPITFISKDENPEEVLDNEKNDTPNYWLLKNTSTDKTKINHKSYVSKKCNLNTDVFFVLCENDEYSELYPVSSWQVFEPDLSAKSLNAYNADITQEKLKAEKNNKRLDEIIERLKNKEESMKINLKTKDMSKKKTIINNSHTNNDNLSNNVSGHSSKNFKNYSSSSDDDLGLKRQEKKRLKNLYKLKKRENKEEIDYVDSALSITEIRKNKSSWDYNDDGKRSDDEDLYMQESAQEFFDDDDENEESDNNSGNEESILTSYGQAMKSLLKQQINDEEDDELNQYSDDEDDEEEDEDDEDEEDENDEDTSSIIKDKNSLKKRNIDNKSQISIDHARNKANQINKKRKNTNPGAERNDEHDSEEDEEDEEDDEDDEDDEEEEDDNNRPRKSIKIETNEKSETNKIHNINEYIKDKIRKNEIQLKKENCAKILLKIIEKNNGKMDILTLLDVLNIKEKNQNFILVQKYIKELCIISSQTINNKKVKMVAVKPKYLSKK